MCEGQRRQRYAERNRDRVRDVRSGYTETDAEGLRETERNRDTEKKKKKTVTETRLLMTLADLTLTRNFLLQSRLYGEKWLKQRRFLLELVKVWKIRKISPFLP